MLSYQNVAQNQYQKEKTIPSPSPLSRPKDNNTNQQPAPVPQPFNTLLPTNLQLFLSLSPLIAYIPRQLKMTNNRKFLLLSFRIKSNPTPKDQSYKSNYNFEQINPQEQVLLEKQQSLREEGEDLKSQLRKLQNENSQLKKVIDQLQSELQSVKNQKSIEQELKAKFDYQEEMILKLKSEVRRKQEALQENQYKLGDLDRMQKKLEDYNYLTSKQNELNKQIKDLQDQVSDQKRQLVYLNSVEHENTNLKGYIETYKQQLREKDLRIEQQREQQEQLYSDNKKMKTTLDMFNFELKKQQENSKDQSHRATIQITELQGQVNSLQKTLANQTHQFELQKQQVKSLENKEKELYSTKTQLLKQEETNQNLNQQNLLQQQDIEKLSMTLKNGKQEFLNQQQKLANAELEIKKQSDQLQQLQKYKDQLVHQCQFLDQELKKKQGNLDQSIALAQHKQIEMKTIQDQQQNQLQFLEGELQKRDSIIFTLDQQNQALKTQLEQYSQADSVNKNELNSNFAKMREMHNDLILYEKQVNSLNMENHQIKLQSQMLQDRNNQLEFEVTKLREQSIQQDNRVRNLETELQSQSFNQKLNTIRMPYTSDQLFPNQQQFSLSNTPVGSFNQQFNLYK